MKGKNFLKVCGILMIIFGGLGIILDLIAVFGAGAAVAVYAAAGVDIGIGTIVAASLVGLAGSVVELIAGIIGVKNCNNIEKTTSCLIMGILVMVLTIVSSIIYFSGVISLIIGLVIPVLYLIGAILNKKQASTAAPAEKAE